MRPSLLLLALSLAAPAGARVVEDQQLWSAVYAVGSVGRFAYHLEVQPRTADGPGRVGQLLLRGAAGYKLTDAVTLYGGYLRLRTEAANGAITNEDRPFAQLSWDLGEVAGGKLSSRTRLEFRRRPDGADTGVRVREFVRWTHPLTTPDRPRALVSLELFGALNRTDWGAHSGFDQARAFAGLELPVGGRSTVEVGYLNQLVNDPARQVRMNHVASLSLWLRP